MNEKALFMEKINSYYNQAIILITEYPILKYALYILLGWICLYLLKKSTYDKMKRKTKEWIDTALIVLVLLIIIFALILVSPRLIKWFYIICIPQTEQTASRTIALSDYLDYVGTVFTGLISVAVSLFAYIISNF